VPLLLSSKCILTENKRLISFGKRFTPLMKKDNLKNEPLYVPKTTNQKEYVNALDSKEDCITVVIGPAGTGKTLMACNSAVNYLKENKIDKIIITRPVVPVEEEIGFLPGSIIKKMDPWTRPIFDILEEYFSKTQVASMMTNGQIEISPLGFMRGRTFKNAFIIADEMQNSSPNQMYMLLTRIGSNSRMVITGDLEQSDKLENNGLKNLIEKIKLYKNSNQSLENIRLIELNACDIQRSELVENVINLYKFKPFQDNKINEIVNVLKKPNNIDPDKFYSDAALIPKKDYKELPN
jgi:phosphate starvation-inducible PhoH-like protein